MSDIKQTWRLIVKKTGEVIIRSHELDSEEDSIKDKSLELIKKKEDHKYRIQYFEDDRWIETVELTVYFN